MVVTVLLVEETAVPGENLPQVTYKLLSDNVVSSTPRPSRIQTQSVSGDRPQWPLMMEETSPIKLIDFSGHKHGLYM
jgi:hypothetical protein